jgi:hypothetical protein
VLARLDLGVGGEFENAGFAPAVVGLLDGIEPRCRGNGVTIRTTKKFSRLAVEVATALASYETPKFKAVLVGPEQTANRTPVVKVTYEAGREARVRQLPLWLISGYSRQPTSAFSATEAVMTMVLPPAGDAEKLLPLTRACLFCRKV